MTNTLSHNGTADWRLYTPVLRAKTSEWKALAALSEDVRSRIAPIVEFVPEWRGPGSSTSSRKRRAPQSPTEYVSAFLDSALAADAGEPRRYVYFGNANQDCTWADVDLWAAFASRAPTVARAIPLADLGLVSRINGLREAITAGNGLGLRIGVRDVEPSLPARLAHTLKTYSLSPQFVHLVFDLKDTPEAVSHDQIRRVTRTFEDFASVVTVAGVFPADLTKYQTGITAEPRLEWQSWQHQHLSTIQTERFLAFGDYTTQCAYYRPSPALPGSVSLRYTASDSILVFRGKQSNSAAGLGYEQIHGHCRLLVRHPEYKGPDFSAGDHRFHLWTDPANGPGNPEQWRTACIVHHITRVVAQLQDPMHSPVTARVARAELPSASST